MSVRLYQLLLKLSLLEMVVICYMRDFSLVKFVSLRVFSTIQSEFKLKLKNESNGHSFEQ